MTTVGHNVQGSLYQFKGAIIENWGRITHNDIAELNGKHDQLVGIVMKRYDISKNDAETEVNKFLRHYVRKVTEYID